MPVRVAVDAMGADRGPEEIVAGAKAAAASRDGIEPVIVGPARLETHGLELVEAPRRGTELRLSDHAYVTAAAGMK